MIMASSEAFRLQKEKYLASLANEDHSHSSDPILAEFNGIGQKLEAITNPESISCLYDLNETFTEWRVLKEQNKSIKRIFSFHDVAKGNEKPDIMSKLNDIRKLVHQTRQTNSLLWDDRYTLYNPLPNTSIEDEVSDEREKRMVDWLLTSSGDDFKAVGIYGMGGSGKTALVKNVLKQKAVGDKFKCIIWACLSQLTCNEEIDYDWIIKYLLYRLGLDTDRLVDGIDEKNDGLMKELERQLLESGNYILVLDDMWHCSTSFVDGFLGRLKKNGGGAVIVTSRRKSVAEKISDKNMLIHLNPCDEDYKESAFCKDETKDSGKCIKLN